MRTIVGLMVVCGAVAAAEPPAKRNILLLIADDLGLQVGCYGDQVARTPNIDALAASGTKFSQAFASVASCSPSRAAILTGLPTHQCGQYGLAHATHNVHTFRDVASLPKLLKAAGYRTGVIGKLHVQPAEVYPWDAEIRVNGRNGPQIAQAARKFITDARDQPFFLLVGFADPHRGKTGFDSTVPIKDVPDFRFAPEQVPVPYHLPDQPEVRAELADYYASVARLDFAVGAVLKELDAAGLTERTLVLFLSDNGIPFPGAKTTLYDAGIHLPLIIRSPDTKRRKVTNRAMVSFTDLAPTMLEWAGVTPPSAMLGKSLLPLLERDDDPERNVVFASHQFHEITMYYPMRAIRTPSHKLIRNLAHPLPFPAASDIYGSQTWQGILRRGDALLGQRSRKTFEQRPKEELYDLRTDPNECRNVVDDPAQRKILEELRQRLLAWQTATRDPWLVKEQHE